jgi:hypothetical protein
MASGSFKGSVCDLSHVRILAQRKNGSVAEFVGDPLKIAA